MRCAPRIHGHVNAVPWTQKLCTYPILIKIRVRTWMDRACREGHIALQAPPLRGICVHSPGKGPAGEARRPTNGELSAPPAGPCPALGHIGTPLSYTCPLGDGRILYPSGHRRRVARRSTRASFRACSSLPGTNAAWSGDGPSAQTLSTADCARIYVQTRIYISRRAGEGLAPGGVESSPARPPGGHTVFPQSDSASPGAPSAAQRSSAARDHRGEVPSRCGSPSGG